MKKVPAARFKEHCLSLLDHLGPEGIVVTKHGKPVARVLPVERASAVLVVGSLRARMRVKGDILSTRSDRSGVGRG
jgi:prevent-host-death family protein